MKKEYTVMLNLIQHLFETNAEHIFIDSETSSE